MYANGVQMATNTRIEDMQSGVGYLVSLQGLKSNDRADIALISRIENYITVKWVVFDSLVFDKVNASLRLRTPHYMIYIENRDNTKVVKKATLSLEALKGVYGLTDLDMFEIEKVAVNHLFLCVVMWAEMNTYSQQASV